MAEPTNTPPDGTVTFVQHHKPPLHSGSYEIVVTQTIATTEIATAKKIPGSAFSARRHFTVAGDRFSLDPQSILALFPAEGSVGDHALALPHIALGRSTLPWERKADGASPDAPWLALLLLDDGEQLGGVLEKRTFLRAYQAGDGEALWAYLARPDVGWLRTLAAQPDSAVVISPGRRAAPKLAGTFAGRDEQVAAIAGRACAPANRTLASLLAPSADGVFWPGVALEAGQRATDTAMVIDLPKHLLDRILPSASELPYLAHVRAGPGGDQAVIVGNRMPRPSGTSTAYLVSLEGRFSGGALDAPGAGPDDLVRLVCLKSWRFGCAGGTQHIAALLSALDYAQPALRLPPESMPGVETYLAAGSVPLPHTFRQGTRAISWYHGPLGTGEHRRDVVLPVRAADELLHYDLAHGIFDVSYAAAWEIGRLLALQDKAFSTGLFVWKRRNIQSRRQAEQRAKQPHLPIPKLEAVAMPQTLVHWLDRLRLLEGVPFNYLVPDERMLPRESIRFFLIDQLWVDALIDGALSIGRATSADYRNDQAGQFGAPPDPSRAITGVVLRSAAVSGWPSLLADAYDHDGTQLEHLRGERLGPDVAIHLFAGVLGSVALHLPPEALHFGADPPDEHAGEPHKDLRDSAGHSGAAGVAALAWRKNAARVLDVGALAETMRSALGLPSISSAQFALQMIAGAPRVVFQRVARRRPG